MLKSNKQMRATVNTANRGKIASLHNRLRINRKTKHNEHPYRNRDKKLNRNTQPDQYSPNQKSYATSFYSREPYNHDQNKTRKLLSKARKRDKSEKKYLAQSQKVMAEENKDVDENYQTPNMIIEELKARPFTTAQGERSFMNIDDNAYSNKGRGVSRKQKIRGARIQNSSAEQNAYQVSQQRNSKQGGYFISDRVSSVDTFKTKKNSVRPPVYQESDVKELKITDYFTGLNRLNRYIKKTKERLRSGNKGIYRSDKQKAKVSSPFK